MPPQTEVNILLVDDHPENLLALEAILDGLGGNLVRAHSGEEALRCLLNQDFAVILLDVQMPGMDGFETATLIRTRARSRETPIIFLTAFSTSDQLMFKGYSLGAVDYLHKPIDSVILTSKVSVFVELFKKTEAVKQQAAQLEAMNADLRQSEERFRSLSACSPIGIFVTDSQGFCIYSNPRCQEKWGLQPGEPLSSQWERTIHSEDQSRILADWTAYLQGDNGFSAEFRTHTGNENTYWVQMYAAPMFSEQGTPLGHVGTCEDITERKLAEAAQSQIIQEQAARREAEAANRMKDEFLAVLSHELRTPLNSMLGWSRLLRSKKFDEATTARALETIERNAATQAQLIEDILDVSQIIRGKLRLNLCPISLASVVEAAITSMRPTADAKAINLKFEVDGSETEIDHQQWMVYGDPVRLQQVVWNLLSNAIKFTSDGGHVQVRLSHVQGGHPDDYSSFKLQSLDSRCAQVTVTDTGKGISPEFLPYVFDRFRQADSTTTRAHSGLGLGLAIVRHLVELQGGRVQADSPGDDQGATFTIRLPLVNGDRTRATEEIVLPSSHALTSSLLTPSTTETLREHPALLASRKILIVDDEPDTRDFLAFLLRQYGATAVVVSSVSEALAVFESVRPDLVISDISMPEQDGYSLIQQLRSLESGADIPAIALTANSREHDRDQALAAGFHVYLAKPVQEAELVSAIVQMLERRGVEARG